MKHFRHMHPVAFTLAGIIAGTAIGYHWGTGTGTATSATGPQRKSPERVEPFREGASRGASPSSRSISGIHQPDKRRHAMRILALELADKDLGTLHARVLDFAAIEDQAMFIEELMMTWQDDPSRALEFAEGLQPSPYRNGVVAQALTLLAAVDPSGAIARLPGLLMGIERHNAMLGIAEQWAASSPNDAMEWALRQSGPARVAMLETLFGVWGANDPGAALSVATGLPDEARDNALGAIIGNWAQSDGNGAFAWARARAEQTGETSLMAISLANAAQADPQAAANSLSGVVDPEVHREAAPVIARTWTARDPEAAWNFVRSIQDPAARASATMASIEVWMDFDPSAASSAIHRLPKGSEERRAATQTFGIGMAVRYNGELPASAIPSDPDFTEELRNAMSLPESVSRDNP
jgi:hypothetical protein